MEVSPQSQATIPLMLPQVKRRTEHVLLILTNMEELLAFQGNLSLLLCLWVSDHGVVPMEKHRVLRKSQEAAGDSLVETLGRSWKADHTACCREREKPNSHCQPDPREDCSLTTVLAATSIQKSKEHTLSMTGRLMLSQLPMHSTACL